MLIDLRKTKARAIKVLRYNLSVDEFFAVPRDMRVDPCFWTATQASLYQNAVMGRIKIMRHGVIDWAAIQRAIGVDLRPLFAAFRGLDVLLSECRLYVEDWVRVFYATLYIAPGREWIQFMYDGVSYRVTRERIAELLGIELRGTSVHR